MDNKFINEQIEIYYKKSKLSIKNKSYSSGLNIQPRTTPNNITKYDEIFSHNNDSKSKYEYQDAELNEDDDFTNFGVKKRNFSISNNKECLEYEKQLPKRVDKFLSINDSYDDLSKIEHISIINEMKHFYIEFTSKLDLNEEKELDNINNETKNLQEPNCKENEFIISPSNNLENNNNNLQKHNHKLNEGISFKSIPLICTNEISTTGDINNEKQDSSENLLKKIHNNDNNDNKYNINKNINTYNKNNNISNNNNSINNKTELNDTFSLVSSFNSSYVVIPQRRRINILKSIFNKKNRNSSISSSQFTVGSNTNTYSINNSDSSNNIGSSSLLLPNINENENHTSLYSSFNYDINDVLNIGINTTIREDANVLTKNSKKKSKCKGNNMSNSLVLSNGHDINSVFKHPDIELIGRISPENSVVSMFLAEKLRKVLPPYYRECQTWELVYSIIDHGASLSTLLLNCSETYLTGSFILAILDSDGYIFGAYLSEIIHVSQRFYGSGECFLWRLNNEKKEIEYYRGSIENQYHIVTEKSFIAFGGGNGEFGLYISNDLLNGYTTPCPTYHNPPLTPKCKFECVNIEIWGFNFK